MSALDPFYAMLRGDADPFRAHPGIFAIFNSLP